VYNQRAGILQNEKLILKLLRIVLNSPKILTMDIKKLFIGGIVGGILYFGLGYLIYGNLLMSFMAKHPGTAMGVDRAQADLQFLYIAAGSLLQGFLLAYIFVRANVSSLASGFVTAGVVGLLSSAGMDCIMYGTTNTMSKTMMAADVAAATVMTAIIGAILGMVMNMGNKAAA
jgi:hypothetical protein